MYLNKLCNSRLKYIIIKLSILSLKFQLANILHHYFNSCSFALFSIENVAELLPLILPLCVCPIVIYNKLLTMKSKFLSLVTKKCWIEMI